MLFFILVLSIFVYIKDPSNGPILPCIFNKITGFYCPGCGMTRAVNSAFHLEFKEAMGYNILIFIVPPLLIMHYFLDKRSKKHGKILLIFIIILVIIYGITRNI